MICLQAIITMVLANLEILDQKTLQFYHWPGNSLNEISDLSLSFWFEILEFMQVGVAILQIVVQHSPLSTA